MQLLTLADLFTPDIFSITTWILARVVYPIVFSLIALGVGRLFFGKWIESAFFRLIGGLTVLTTTIYGLQLLQFSVHRSIVLIWAAIGLLGLTHRNIKRSRSWESLSVLFGFWILFVAFQSRHFFPVDGDPLAFLVHAKQWLLSGFQPSAVDPAQRAYPDWMIVILASWSLLFGIDPIIALQGLAPLISAGLFSSGWFALNPMLRNLSIWTGLLITVFTALIFQEPFRSSVLFGRYPYAIAAMVGLVWIGRRVRGHSTGLLELGLVLSTVVLAHPAWVPTLVFLFIWSLGAEKGGRNWLRLVGGGVLSLLIASPRLVSLSHDLKNMTFGPEVRTEIVSTYADWIRAIWDHWLLGSWHGLTRSPVSQLGFVVAMGSLIHFWFRSWLRHERLHYFWIFWFWIFTGLGCVGITETLGISVLSSHYSKRQLGLVLAFAVASGLSLLLTRTREHFYGKWVNALMVTVMCLHLGAVFYAKARDITFSGDYFSRNRGSFELLQELDRVQKNEPSRVQGLLSEAKSEKGFLRNLGAGFFFPYFFHDRKAFLAFVPTQGMRRDLPSHLKLYQDWLEYPSSPEALSQFRSLGINWILGSNEWTNSRGQKIKESVSGDPAHYRIHSQNEAYFLAEIVDPLTR